MSHSCVKAYYHCIFSTRDRRAFIGPELQLRLFPYIGGIARAERTNAVAVGGTEDHVHLLLELRATAAIAKALQVIKANSSKWVHETYPRLADFAWQQGYGAFTIGASQVERTVKYIGGQKEHHRTQTFQEELLEFLE